MGILPKDTLALFEGVSGAAILGFLVYCFVTMKIVPGPVYDHMKAKCEFWEKKYTDFIESRIK